MRPFETWVLTYLINALWQVPFLFLSAWVAARLLHREHPRVEHRLWVAALLLEVTLPACDLPLETLWPALRFLLPWARSTQGTPGNIHVLLGKGVVFGSSHRLAGWLCPGITLAFAALLLYLAARLAWGLRHTALLQRNARPLDRQSQAFRLWQLCCGKAAIPLSRCILAVSAEVAGPMTVGLLRPTVLLPPSFLDQVSLDDLHTVLAHELVHIARHDFARNLLYSALSLPVAWHPLLWRTRAHVAESRELACDAIAAEAVAGRVPYARSLIRLASLLSPSQPFLTNHAVGMLDGQTFQRRVMTLTRKPRPASLGHHLAVGVLCSILTLATCGTALALHAHVADANPPAAPSPAGNSGPPSIKPEVMAGSKIGGDIPVYPPDAKRDKIEGAVLLNAQISEKGTVEHLNVISGPAQLTASALDAVRTWRYRPFLLHGEPVAVETTITITYSLAH